MLDKRLTACAELVGGEGIVCDVGTDHAYLAAELITSGKCSKVIASDVKEGPLASAKATVEKYGIADKVELILSDGLKNVSLDGVSDIVIAGMGGETIAAIIGGIEKLPYSVVRFILQPMTKPELLRKELYKLGFTITEERTVEESGKLYVIMLVDARSGFEGWLTETESIYGFFDGESGRQYRQNESERLSKIAVSLEKAGKQSDATHYEALAYRMKNGTGVEEIDDVIAYLNSLYPFNLQEKWDNSGYLVESRGTEVSKILLTLDITNEAVMEADLKGAELIISHHPVIFDARKRLLRTDPVYKLVQSGIGAVCMHTNLDIAYGGTNGVILGKLKSAFGISAAPEPFEEIGSENNLGWIVTLDEPADAETFGKKIKEIFGCEYIRMSGRSKNQLSKIAFCSGSGGSMIGLAMAKGCDALITGDVKHDVWIDANNHNFALYDCGHFHTENIVLTELRRVLEEKFPQLDVEIAESSVDPCVYI
ncbi:MAG TPA: Nif3-like dinuclear metal center hexameric protein [Ruminococcus flavefaciens]|nr:Nif3-like dinuclear metal center hexameric protein [Ruminococcus flavefaciens]HQM00320.1 Nif3-like dinuclear metal center hexameric protein [Ruminococcus flavefaciens]